MGQAGSRSCYGCLQGQELLALQMYRIKDEVRHVWNVRIMVPDTCTSSWTRVPAYQCTLPECLQACRLQQELTSFI